MDASSIFDSRRQEETDHRRFVLIYGIRCIHNDRSTETKHSFMAPRFHLLKCFRARFTETMFALFNGYVLEMRSTDI